LDFPYYPQKDHDYNILYFILELNQQNDYSLFHFSRSNVLSTPRLEGL